MPTSILTVYLDGSSALCASRRASSGRLASGGGGAFLPRSPSQPSARLVTARLVTARLVTARLVTARLVTARLGSEREGGQPVAAMEEGPLHAEPHSEPGWARSGSGRVGLSPSGVAQVSSKQLEPKCASLSLSYPWQSAEPPFKEIGEPKMRHANATQSRDPSSLPPSAFLL